jgi:hypothetical protein
LGIILVWLGFWMTQFDPQITNLFSISFNSINWILNPLKTLTNFHKVAMFKFFSTISSDLLPASTLRNILFHTTIMMQDSKEIILCIRLFVTV